MVNDLSNYLTQKQRIEALEKEVQRLNVINNKLERNNKKLRDALIKINGVTMRTLHD